MTELTAPSRSLRSATPVVHDRDANGTAPLRQHAEAARDLIRAGTAPGSLDVVAEIDRAAALVGLFLVVMFGIYVLLG